MEENCFEEALHLVEQAGKVINETFHKEKLFEMKSSPSDLVTETDKEVEKFLIGGLKKKFPTHKFIAEESVAAGEKCILTEDPTWIIDPVDGTMNFVHKFPFVAISVALIYKKVTQAAIIYNPILKQMFTAQCGKGAYLNGKQIQVSKIKDLKESLLIFELGTSKNVDKMKCIQENIRAVIPNVRGVRSLGSAALNMALVACGSVQLYFEFGIHCWDMAAGDLLVREAGGIVVDTTGEPFDLMACRVLCSGSADVADQASRLMIQHQPVRDDAI